MSIFGIAISGLHAAQAGLVTTGHNIANASTPGYHRQEVLQSNAIPQLTGAGFFGSGVQVDSVRRVYTEFLDAQASRAQAQSSYFSTYSEQIGQIDNILSDPSAGLAPELQSFFAGVHEVAAHPASVPSRQALLSSGSTLAARFQSLDNRFVEMNLGVNAQVQSTIASVNTYAREIAALNLQITGARASPTQQPNDLMDVRDKLIADLNSLVGATTLEQSDGNVSVTIGNGQSLVVGGRAFLLGTQPSAETPDQTDVTYLAGATAVTLGSSLITNGSLGALLAFRAGPLADARNELGRIAVGLAQTFNNQHHLGQDLSGVLGTDFFNVPTAAITANRYNTGTAVMSVVINSPSTTPPITEGASDLSASDYRLAYDPLAAGGLVYQLTRLSDGNATSYTTLPQTVDGITIQMTGGGMLSGDTFLIEPTRYAARNMNVMLTSPTEIAAAAPMRTAAVSANAGTATISPGTVNTPNPANAAVNANLKNPISITFTNAVPMTFDVTDTTVPGAPVVVAAGVTYSAGADITYNGWTVKIAGLPVAGDTFKVESNLFGVSDNRNAGRLADLQVTNTLSGHTASYQSSYAQITSSVGNIARDMSVSAKAQDAIALRARETQQSVSGVNLDEEAANLLRYQQAYQASGKVIEVASTLFDTILAIGR